MGFVEDLRNKVAEYLSGDYEIGDFDGIPTVSNLAFGKKAKRVSLCAFCIDLRHSTVLLFQHQSPTAGKIHKSFLAVSSSVILKYGGKIRSFQGDSILAFWSLSNISHLMDAVRAAMEIKWFLSDELSDLFEDYTRLDYGIGIDCGEVIIIRAGIPVKASNSDLVFIGKCVNFAVAIANKASSPENIEISSDVYDNLQDTHIYSNGVNMWRNSSINWNGQYYNTKCTNFNWGL